MLLSSDQMIYRKFPLPVQVVFALMAIFLVGFISYESLVAVSAEPMTNHLDKLIHLLAYGALGFVTLPALRHISPALIWVGTGMFGVLIEILQGQMGIGRNAELWDGVANFSGAFLAVIAWVLISSLFRTVASKAQTPVEVSSLAE